MERTAKTLHRKLLENKSETQKLYYDFLEDKTHGDALHIACYHAFETLFKSEKD